MPQPIDSRFPEAIQELWSVLTADVVWLHGRWILYCQLFGTNKERVELLNESAGTVTWVMQNLFLQDVQISLSKIGDPAGAGNRKNLTLRRLQVELRQCYENLVADKMEPLLENFELSCEQVRKRRNKWLAHSDLPTKLTARATPLTGPSRTEIEKALEALRNVLNCVQCHYTGSEMAYEHFILDNDGENLIAALAKAKRYGELLKEGVVPKGDFRKRFPKGI